MSIDLVFPVFLFPTLLLLYFCDVAAFCLVVQQETKFLGLKRLGLLLSLFVGRVKRSFMLCITRGTAEDFVYELMSVQSVR